MIKKIRSYYKLFYQIFVSFEKSGYLCRKNKRNMKKTYIVSLFAAVLFALSSCTSIKNIPYLKNADTVNLEASRMLYDAKIMPKDELTIYVNTTDPDASSSFNLVSYNQRNGGASRSNRSGNGYTIGYLVDNEGNINFPVLGKLHVSGMTKNECQDMIASRIKEYLAESENPIVTVQMSSYHVTVLGEVGSAGVIPVTTEKMNILEAIASAGDLTIYGHRENVMLIREDNRGQKSIHRLNLNDASLMNSPYYYLQQNDIIYVEPQGVKARNAFVQQNTSLYFTAVSVITSLATLVTLILKK